MELELKKEALDFYEFSTVATAVHEESTETIVPDYCPDIARIIDSDGKVFLRSKDIQGDKAIVTGAVKVTVLFTPEGETGIRNFEFALPFNASSSNQDFEHCQCLFAKVCIQSIETKLLNPRKIFTKAILTLRLQGLREKKMEFCNKICANEACGIAQLTKTEDLNLICSFAEKDFTFADEVTVPAGKEAVMEILLANVTTRIQETKIFGNKLIIKGILLAEFLYRNEESGASSAFGELPFSQIIEINEAPENATAAVSLQVSGMDYHIGGEENPNDRHRITLAVYLNAQACIKYQKPFSYVSDVYSTAYDVKQSVSGMQCTGKTDTIHQRQSIHQIIEVGVVPSSVLSSAISFDEVNINREEKLAVFQTMAHIKLLFLDEGGVPLITERQMECSCKIEVPEDLNCTAQVNDSGDLSTAISSSGIEVRFSADFTVETSERKQLLGLVDLEIDTETPKDTSALPSIVLKLFDEDQRLWDIAKRYSTTVDVIRAANDMTEECTCGAGQMLLIPRKR